MANPIVTDELWEVIEPLLPEELSNFKWGRPRIDDRAALTGIIFVLKSGIPWKMLPQELSCGSGMTCWRRLEEWEEAGVWEQRIRSTGSGRLGLGERGCSRRERKDQAAANMCIPTSRRCPDNLTNER